MIAICTCLDRACITLPTLVWGKKLFFGYIYWSLIIIKETEFENRLLTNAIRRLKCAATKACQ